MYMFRVLDDLFLVFYFQWVSFDARGREISLRFIDECKKWNCSGKVTITKQSVSMTLKEIREWGSQVKSSKVYLKSDWFIQQVNTNFKLFYRLYNKRNISQYKTNVQQLTKEYKVQKHLLNKSTELKACMKICKACMEICKTCMKICKACMKICNKKKAMKKGFLALRRKQK